MRSRLILLRRPLSGAQVIAVWLGLVGLWWLAAYTQRGPGTLLPYPDTVFSNLWDGRSAYLANAGTTLHEAALGFGFATVIAIVAALAATWAGSLSGVIQNLAIALYAMPLLALAPALVLWTGSGLTTKVIIAALASFFPIMINLTQALRTTSPQALELMRSAGASRWAAFRYVELPYALPMLFSGLMIAGPAAVIGAMLAEWVGANQGLGILLVDSMQEFNIPELYGCMVVASLLSLLLYTLFALSGRRLFPWHPSLQPIGASR
jgi:ABC-type nitrate/sulfonate/bicarbonate transport system permease component